MRIFKNRTQYKNCKDKNCNSKCIYFFINDTTFCLTYSTDRQNTNTATTTATQ